MNWSTIKLLYYKSIHNTEKNLTALLGPEHTKTETTLWPQGSLKSYNSEADSKLVT